MFLTDVSKLSRQSHAKVKVICQLNCSDNCQGTVVREYKDAMNTIECNDGKYICLQCIKSLGINNPNCKYYYDRNILSNIDTEEKAYLLGWIASDGGIEDQNWNIRIKIHQKDIDCLKILRDIICEDIIITYSKENMVLFNIPSLGISEDVCRHLQINRGKKNDVVKFPNIEIEDIQWAFIRGYFEGNGSIKNYDQRSSPECTITSDSSDMLAAIGEFSKIPYVISSNKIYYYDCNCIDFMGKIYANCGKYKLDRKYETYVKWITWRPYIFGQESKIKLPECFVFKTDKNAILPNKNKPSDVGYDLTIIKEEKKLNNKVTLYDTGIRLRVNHGLYVEVVPRSSLSKSGYILANSIGIIDNSYNGNIFIALAKIDDDSPNIELPFRCCQLIFRQQMNVNIIEVADKFDETSRDEGGFGSSGN